MNAIATYQKITRRNIQYKLVDYNATYALQFLANGQRLENMEGEVEGSASNIP
jgi:hypothetical protein